MPQRPPVRVLLAIGLVAGSTLAFQVLLTRIFSAVLFYHFGFLAISLALLGIGAGAILIYVRPRLFERPGLEIAMARFTVAYGVLLLLAVALILRLDYTYEGITVGFVLNLGAACVLAALPFLAAGIAIGLAVKGYVSSIGRVYAFDLAGAGIGALAIVPAMWLLDAPRLVAVLALVAALAAALFSGRRAAEAGAAAAVALAACGLLALSVWTQVLDVTFGDSDRAQAERWTPLSRVLGFLPSVLGGRPDGPPGSGDNGVVIYDKVIGEIVPFEPGQIPGWSRLQLGPQSIGYELTGPGDALIIGGGGGRDILNALSSGQRRVDVIELNRGIRRVVDEDLREFSGAPYSLPRVSTSIGDGRSTLADRERRYDQVHIGFTDTFSASSAQAFALTESNLYTVEAFDEYLDHLKPGGVLNVSRPQRHLGDEAIRATVLALEALRRRGISKPERNVMVVLGLYKAPFKDLFYGTILTRLEPFTAAEVASVRRLARERGTGVGFAPGGPFYQEWGQLARAPSLEAFCEGYRVNVCPPTDDKPFFFHMKRLSGLGVSTSSELGVPDPMIILVATLGILLVLSALAFALPLRLVPSAGRPDINSLLFFAAIGVGFLVLEVVLIQRFVLFLGFPTYALSVVLFSLLVFTGIGSLMSERAGQSPKRALTAALAVGCVMIAAGAFGLQPLLRLLIELPFPARVASAVLLLAPLGIVLGTAMPLGLTRLRGLYPQGVPWAWGINGLTSVLATVLALTVAVNWGFAVTTLLALACYLGALAHAHWGRWPEAAPTTDDASAAAADAPPGSSSAPRAPRQAPAS